MPYNEATMIQACQDIDDGASLRGTAVKYNIGNVNMHIIYKKKDTIQYGFWSWGPQGNLINIYN